MRDHEVVRRFDLLRLSRGDYWIIIKCGLLIAASAFVVAGVLAVVTSTESWSYVCTPPLIGILYSLWMTWAAGKRLTPTQRDRLTTQVMLIRQCEALRAASNSAAADLETTQARIKILIELTLRMRHVDADRLAERIAEVEETIKTLELRVRTNELLVAGYDHEYQRLEVEIEALDIVQGSSGAGLESKLAELAGLEENVAQRRQRVLAAREVVELLTGTRRVSSAREQESVQERVTKLTPMS